MKLIEFFGHNYPSCSAFRLARVAARGPRLDIFRTTEKLSEGSQNLHANLVDKDDLSATNGMIANCLR
jgi:hypothetical protein